MKLKQFFQPPDLPLSSPKAARKLLRLLAWVLLLCMVIAVIFYLTSRFYGEVSHLRRQMNDAVYSAQLYLSARESFVTHLNRSAVFREESPQPVNRLSDTLPLYGRVNIALGNPGSDWSILLSGRDVEDLDELSGDLIYVAAGSPLVVNKISGHLEKNYSVPKSVLLQLTQDIKPEVSNVVQWIADPKDLLSRVYFFMRLSSDREAGWLGVSIIGAEISAALSAKAAGRYMLLDQYHRLILGSSGAKSDLNMDYSNILAQDSFSFIGEGVFPKYLALSKRVGGSNWTLIYYVDIWELFLTMSVELFLVLILCAAGVGFVVLIVQRVNRTLIGPAQEQLEELVENEKFCRTLIHTSPVALCVLRREDGKVILQNPLAEQWLGAGEERQRLNIGWLDQEGGAYSSRLYEEIETVDGRHLLLNSTPTRYKGEEVLFCALSDISERKQAEKALQEAKHLADAANEAKTVFLATMSHEIRTPLYGLLGTLELLSLTSLSTRQKNYLKSIQRSSSTLQQLINDILDVSKIEAGQLVLDLLDFSPLDLVQDAVSSYCAAARNKGLNIYACCDPSLPDVVRGDASRIRQILNNLLSNAVKFTESGQVVVRVRVHQRDGERVTLVWQVTDTGIGIAAEDHKFLFDAFFQSNDHISAGNGSGLGLSICRRLAQLMSGEIRVVSERGLGSSFSLALPLEVGSGCEGSLNHIKLLDEPIHVYSPVRELADSMAGWLCRLGARAQVGGANCTPCSDNEIMLEILPGKGSSIIDQWQGPHIIATSDYCESRLVDGALHVDMHNLHSIGCAVATAQGVSVSRGCDIQLSNGNRRFGLRVLVAEDNPVNQMVLKEQLESLGCRVVMTADGREALMTWQSEEFDLVLTDLHMPNKNGYELAHQLRQLGCRAPIVGATAHAFREEIVNCLAVGMNLCLIKPLDLRTLFNSISAFNLEVK